VALLRALRGPGEEQRWRYLHLATHGFFDPPRPALHPAVLGAWAVGAGATGGLAGLAHLGTVALVADEPGALDRERGFDPTGRTYRTYERNPLVQTGLVLGGANRGGPDGRLTAEEIAGLDLRGTELAVLSACETALGKVEGWQGVMNLQRGFHDAGVRNVSASLWKVNDAATALLMGEFYRRLWGEKEAPLEALRQAQLFVLRNPDRVLAQAKVLALRGIGDVAVRKAKPAGGRSPVAWWAAWVLSGPPGAGVRRP
jgi:CHAT domain-containing protein